MGFHDQPPEPCPACKTPSKCVHFESVHNGVGYMYFDHIWECPTHGDFAYGSETGKPAFRDGCTEHTDRFDNGLLGIACAMTTMPPSGIGKRKGNE